MKTNPLGPTILRSRKCVSKMSDWLCCKKINKRTKKERKILNTKQIDSWFQLWFLLGTDGLVITGLEMCNCTHILA